MNIQTSKNPIPIVFLLKLYDDSVYDVLLDMVDRLQHCPEVEYYVMNDKCVDLIKNHYPNITPIKWRTNDI